MTKRASDNLFSSTAMIAVSLGCAAPASAQDVPDATATAAADQADADSGVQDIVVTAQRREQRLQDVPIAVTAFSSEGLREAGIKNTDQIAGFTPNLTWNQSQSIGSNIGLRGIIDSNITTNQVASVGIVVDEVSLNSPVLNTIPLFDIERVEVLRGPQVTLYGRSTTAGAVNFYTRHPEIGSGQNGYLDLSYGNYDAVNVEAAFGGDLGSKAAARLAFLSQNRQGIYYDPTLRRRVSDRDRQGARLGLTLEPTDNFTIFANVQWGRDRGGGPYFKSSGQRNPANPAQPCAPTTSHPGIDPCVDDSGFHDSPDFGLVFTNELSRQDIDVFGGLVNMRYDFGDIRLTSITAYLENQYRLAYDNDGQPAGRGLVNNDTDTNQFSEELRLSSAGGKDAAVNWIAGLYYFRENQNGAYSLTIRDNATSGSPPGAQFRSFAWDQKNEIYSGYAQIDWKFAPGWELSLGGRYSDEKKSGSGISRWSVNPGFFGTNPDVPVPGAPIWNAIKSGFPIGTFFSRSVLENQLRANLVATLPYGQTWKNAGGKIGLNWKPDNNTLLYASYSRGFKGGTFNLLPAVRLSNPASAARFLTGVRPEKLTTYEVGTKLDLFDRMLRLNAALFWNDYSDQQQTVFDPVSFGLILANAANATIKGVEVEVEWKPMRGLLIQSGIGLLDAKYGKFVATPGDPLSDFSGQHVVQSSKFNWNGLIRKSFDIGSGKLSFQGSFKHFTKYAYVAENIAVGRYSPLVIAPKNTLYDARIAFAFGASNAFEISLWGKNLSNERYCATNGSTTHGSGQCGPNEPRTYGLSARASF